MFDAPSAISSLVRVDLVAVLGGKRAGRSDRLGIGEQREPECAGEQALDVREADARQVTRRASRR